MKIDPKARPPTITIPNYGKMPHSDEQAAEAADFRSNFGAVEPRYVRT
jgi:hypothetical protein